MTQPTIPRRIPWHLILIFLFLSLGILSSGYFYYDREQAYLKQEKLNEISAIADLKIRQIVDWRKERLADASLIMKDHFFAARVKYWLEGRAKPELKDEILHRLQTLLVVYRYQNIVLLDLQGRMVLSVGEEEQSPASSAQDMALEAIQTRKVIFSDLYHSRDSQVVRLSIFMPILLSQGTEEVGVGVILMWIDPHQFLYPLIQSWPTPSRSAETVLLRREGEEVLILNELRNRQGTALTLRFPLQEAKLPAAMAAKGQEGVIEGIDYRGEPVVAVVGSIPDSPWYLVAKIDTAEIYASLRGLFRMVLLFSIFLITGAGVSLALIWSNQQRRFFRQQYEMDRDREKALQKLNEELVQHAAMIQDLYNNAPCGYQSLDAEGKFVQINDTELTLLGYTRDEVVGRMKFEDILTADGREIFHQNFPIFLERGWVRDLEYDLIRKDGTHLPVLLSATAVTDEAGHFLMSRGTVYDLTDRVRAGAALARERQRLFQVLEQLPAYVALLAPDYTVQYANREFIRRFGAAEEGQRCYEYLFGRDKPCEDCNTFKVLETNACQEWEWLGPDGRTYGVFDYPFTDEATSPPIDSEPLPKNLSIVNLTIAKWSFLPIDVLSH